MYREQVTFHCYEVLEYDRKSRTDDPLMTVDEILEKHGKILEEYASKNLGGPIPEENKYKEVGSGESIDSRPEMLRLLRAVESPAVKAVIVVDVQRLSRGDLEDAGRLIKILRYTNTYVITPMKTYDLRDEYDRDAFERELKRGNEYLEYFKKIQARGRLASVKEGNYIGSVAPFGYNRTIIKDGKKDCHTLIENKEEANVVRMIFDWYCNDDIGVTAICRRLEEMGIKTKNGCKTWKPSIIFSILENMHYIGYVRWNWRKTIKIIEDQEIKKLRPKAKVDEYLIFAGRHDPIISEELFTKAQKIKGNRHRTKRNTSLKNPLSGIMFCKCGSKMGYNTYRKNGEEYAPPKLVCNNQVHCKSGSADFYEIMEYVCGALRESIDDFTVMVDNEDDNSTKLHLHLIKDLEKKLKDLENKEIIQWEAQYDPDPDKRLPQHVFKRLNEKLLSEKEEIKKALCKARESVPTPVDYKQKIASFSEALEALENPEISPKIKNQYLKEIIERIEYHRPPIVRITKDNADKYKTATGKGLRYHIEPYRVKIILR